MQQEAERYEPGRTDERHSRQRAEDGDAGHLEAQPELGILRAEGEADIKEGDGDQRIGGDMGRALLRPAREDDDADREQQPEGDEDGDFRCVKQHDETVRGASSAPPVREE